MSSYTKSVAMTGAASALGTLQALALRDGMQIPVLSQVTGMLPAPLNQPGTFGGVLGAVALGLGFYGKMYGKIVTDDLYQNMLIMYGVPALVGGLYNYFLPKVMYVPAASAPAGTAFAVMPSEPVAAEWVMRRLDEGIL